MGNSSEKKESTKIKPTAWNHTMKEEADSNGKVLTYAWILYNNAKLDDNAIRYIFEVRRYKITATKEEYLNVKVYEITEWDENGEISNYDECAEIERVSIIDLEGKLLNLRTYGVIMERKHFPKVRQAIEKAYPILTARFDDNNDSTLLTPDVTSAIYEMFVHYIKEVGIDAEVSGKISLYNIPVSEFKEYLADTKFSKYKYSDIREGLANFTKSIDGKDIKGTKCSFGRKDNTIAKGDKRIKVISFVKEVVDSYQIT